MARNSIRPVTVIGGFPEPLGGVTTFISRLAARNMVAEVVDLYPSKNKKAPRCFRGTVFYLKSFTHFIFFYFMNFKRWNGRFLHFNFSNARASLIFLFLPKIGGKFALMLHHGELRCTGPRLLYRLAFSRIDVIYCMSEKQETFYKNLSVTQNKITRISSYVPPVVDHVGKEIRREIDSFFSDERVFVASGFPKGYYNHSWCIRYVTENPGYKLALFIYGSGEIDQQLNKMATLSDRVKIFRDYDQKSFNYALKKAYIYLRPTDKDSFGIAVADAIEFGKKSLASDVCKRYPGTYLFTPENYKTFRDSLNATMIGANTNIENKNGFINFEYQKA